MNTREMRGQEIADNCEITKAKFGYRVPSQFGRGHYRVTISGPKSSCTCPDSAKHGYICKHAYAVRIFLARPKNPLLAEKKKLASPNIKKQTYRQKWKAYNSAQTSEKHLFQKLLSDLCNGIPDERQQKGRPRIPLPVAVFACAFKVYTTLSGRRFMSDLSDAFSRGFVSKLPHYNSIFNAMEDPEMTPLLYELITISSLPLKVVETDFAADSSGFSTSRFTRWYDHKYGKSRTQHDWVKCHIMCGVKTNVVTAVEIAGPTAGDSPQLPALLQTTAKNFNMNEVSADMGYLSRANVMAINKIGAEPFIPFKSTSKSHKKDNPLWRKMYHLFQYNREEFASHYHKRSNVETVFSMVKAKFRDHIRSRSDVAMVNECLCKFLCHNICCVIQEMHELGIDPTFWR